jgi:purine-binding chemotaxis protein CheW
MTHHAEADLQDWLQEVRAEYWARLGQTAAVGGAAGCTHVLFEVAGMRFAVEAPLCKGVLRRPRSTRLPGLPPHLLGVSGIRGEVVSVVDPRLFLGLPGARPAGREGFLLLLARDGVKAALWVDRVTDVVSLSAAEVLAAEAPWAHLPEGILLGQWGEGAVPVFVLDGARLLTASGAG